MKKNIKILLGIAFSYNLNSCSNPNVSLINKNTETVNTQQQNNNNSPQNTNKINNEGNINSTAKNYIMPDTKENLPVLKNVKLNNSMNSHIDNNGNGIIIIGNTGKRINNFKITEQSFNIGDDVGNTSITLDEKGNGIVIWDKPFVITISSLEDAKFKYRQISNYLPTGEIKALDIDNFNLTDKININSSGNGEIIIANRNESIYELKSVKINNYLVTGFIENIARFNIPERQKVMIDKNGNGYIIENNGVGFAVTANSEFPNETNIRPVKNYNLQEKIRLTSKNISDINSINFSYDDKGNGYVSWNYDYQVSSGEYFNIKSEIIIKKLNHFIPEENEINLGYGYNTGSVNLNANGNGIIIWQASGASDIYVREIKNYIPQNDPLIITENNRHPKIYTNININKFGDGIVFWMDNNYPVDGSVYGRFISEYSIKKIDSDRIYKPVPNPSVLK